jgi:hypothetical protein
MGVAASRQSAAFSAFILFSDDGFLPKAAMPQNSRSVWTAVASAPLFVRTKVIHHSKFSARPIAPLKPAHSKRFAHFESHHTTRQRLGLRRPSAAFPRSAHRHTRRLSIRPVSRPPISAFAFGFRLHRISTRQVGATGVAASRQSAAFYSFIFQMAAFSRKPLRSEIRGASGLR